MHVLVERAIICFNLGSIYLFIQFIVDSCSFFKVMLFLSCNRLSVYRLKDYEDNEKRDEVREQQRDDFAAGSDSESSSVFLLSKLNKKNK